MAAGVQTVGVIADTHGLVRPEALAALRGVDRILHAGDIGGPEVLRALEAVAPVTAVRGNNDRGAWAETIAETEAVEVAGAWLYVLHDVKELTRTPPPEKVDVVISGHSHKPSFDWRDGVLFLNPGSAGPRRFKLPIAVARLIVRGRSVRPELIALG